MCTSLYFIVFHCILCICFFKKTCTLDAHVNIIAVGRSGYVIRIINQLSTNCGLLNGFTDSITDVTFAHATSDYLATIHQGGNLYVWKLEEKSMEVKYPPLFIVMMLTLHMCKLLILNY